MASTSNNFDIGKNDGIAIFSNSAAEDENAFFNDSGMEPNLIIDTIPFNREFADIGMTENVTSGIDVDITNEDAAVFEKPKKNIFEYDPTPKQAPKQTNKFQQPPPRQKVESYSSDATIEAEPVVKKHNNNNKHNHSHNHHANSHKEEPESPPPINFGFDDLLDARKLKPPPVPKVEEDSATPDQSPIRPYNYGSSTPLPTPPQTPQPKTQKSSYQTSNQTSYKNPPAQKSNLFTEEYTNEEDEKLDILLKLKALEQRKGITLSKHYSPKSSLEELKMEYRNQSKMLETDAGVKFMRKGLIFCTSGMEYMNRRFDPVGAKLDGWGESIMENIMDFDGIFERLHQKYSGSVEMEPEMELLFALAGSAFMFHLSHTVFKSAIPQFGNVLRENPDLVQGLFGAVKEAANRNNNQQPQNAPMPYNNSERNMQPPPMDISAILGQLGLGGNGGQKVDQRAENIGSSMANYAQAMGNPPPRAVATQDIKEPPMGDIFRKMMQQADDDNLSITSHDSERSLGLGSKKAVISPIPKSRTGGGGGNIIKL